MSAGDYLLVRVNCFGDSQEVVVGPSRDEALTLRDDLRSERPYRTEFIGVWRDGDDRWVEWPTDD